MHTAEAVGVDVGSPEPAQHVLDISGDMTIRGITGLRDQLSDAFGHHSSVVARISDDVLVDLTFIQLMEAARVAASEADIDFALHAPAAGPVLETLERGGFLGAAQAARRQFWLMETESV